MADKTSEMCRFVVHLALFLPFCSHFALANVTAGCCCGKLELIEALAKVSQAVTPGAWKRFRC